MESDKRSIRSAPQRLQRSSRNSNRAMTCYGISPYHSEGMLSDNPHSGIYEAKTCRSVGMNGCDPSCNQGGVMVLVREADDVSENDRSSDGK